MERALSELDVKDVVISLSVPLAKERLLMVLGGRAPAPEWLHEFAESADMDVWAVDRGVDACMASGVVPSVLIGDRDSASPEAWQWARDKGAAEKNFSSDKDFTDFQLALDLWRDDPETSRKMPVITGCFGGRLDHLFSNLQSFSAMKSRTERRMSRCMVDDQEGVFLLYSADEAEFLFREKPLAVSLLPLSDKCLGVSIEGVRWPLEDVMLERGLPWAISNETLGEKEVKISVRCGRGILGGYWYAKRGK